MKWILVLTLTFAVYSWTWQKVLRNWHPDHSQEPQIAFQELINFLEEFAESNSQSALLKHEDPRKNPLLWDVSLFQPDTMFPQTQKYDSNFISKLFRFNTSCAGTLPLQMMDPNQAKSVAFESALCIESLGKLPENFYSTAPFIHPGGGSFAYRAYLQQESNALKEKFFLKYKAYFHVEETIKIPYPPLPVQDTFSKFLESEAYQFFDGFNLLVGERLVALISTNRVKNKQYLSFFRRDIFDKKLLEKMGMTFTNQSHFFCHVRLDNSCFLFNKSALFSWYNLAGGLAFFACFLLVIFYVRSKEMRLRQAEESQFVLNSLTHELRTPVASLVLCFDSFQSRFQELTPKWQSQLTVALEEMHRLEELVRDTVRYVSYFKAEKLQRMSLQNIPSITDFLENLFHDFSGAKPFKFVLKPQDFSLNTDPFWLRFCLFNIIKNSYDHGDGVFQILVEKKKNEVTFMIQNFKTAKGIESKQVVLDKKKSSGMGMALRLIQNRSEYLGGQFSFRSNNKLTLLSKIFFVLGKTKQTGENQNQIFTSVLKIRDYT